MICQQPVKTEQSGKIRKACQSEVGAIKSIVLKRPQEAFIDNQNIDRQWRALNYSGPPDITGALEEYDQFLALLRKFDMQVSFLPQDGNVGLDSIYTRDAAIICAKGVILGNMGKEQRSGEPAAQKILFEHINVPIHGIIEGQGRVEGGDVAWLDEHTIAVARSYRTNDQGIRQLRELLEGCVDEMIVVPLTHWRGPGDVFHLMSILSPLDHDLALVYSRLMPIPFREALLAREIELIEVPDSEFATMGCNVLAVAPRKCIMLAGNPITNSRLEKAGVEVHEFVGAEISLKGGGGPTCLTRPILRAEC